MVETVLALSPHPSRRPVPRIVLLLENHGRLGKTTGSLVIRKIARCRLLSFIEGNEEVVVKGAIKRECIYIYIYNKLLWENVYDGNC